MALTEVRLVVDLRLVVAGRIARQRVDDAERLRRNEPAADDRERSIVPRVQVLAERDRAARALLLRCQLAVPVRL